MIPVLPGRRMTPERFAESIAKLGFKNRKHVSRFFARRWRASDNWARRGPPAAVAMLLYIMETLKISPEEAESILKRQGKDPLDQTPIMEDNLE